MGAKREFAAVDPIIRVEERAGVWPVYWSPILVGTLTAVAVALVIGLLAVAFGAHALRPGARLGPEDFGFAELVASVCGAFFSFAAGGWVAARMAGTRQAENAMLQGAVVWLVSVPLFLVLMALGAASLFGVWYAGLAGTPAWVTPAAGAAGAEAAQEAAGGAATALLIGLVGAVLGGWAASGEPMTFTYQRRSEA
jgi:hypothetical protein